MQNNNNNIPSTVKLQGLILPEIRRKNKPTIFIGSWFWWEFRREWQPLVELAKKFKLKFDKDLKRWRLYDPITQYEILEYLVDKLKENPNNIDVFDFETEQKLETHVWINTLRQKKVSHFKPEVLNTKLQDNQVKMWIEQGRCRIKIPLKRSGSPKFAADNVVYGLVKHACGGVLMEDNTIHFTRYIKEACDYIIHNTEVQIDGVPKLFDKPMIIHTFKDCEVFPHQKIGIQFLYSRKKALLADDMGIGKSLQALLAMQQLLIDGEITNLVIVCPVTLVANWWREIKKWDTSFNEENTQVIPYSQLHKPSDIKPKSAIIFDEAHYMKVASSRRTRTAIELCAHHDFQRTWLLTGTPVTKDNSDLWPLCMLLDHPISKEFSPTMLSGMKGDRNAIISGALKTHMLMRKKEDCLNLPPKIIQNIQVNLGLKLDYSGLQKDSPDALFEHIMKLKRITATAKVPATVEFVKELLDSGKKVVVFSEHVEALHVISAKFTGSVLLDGGTKQANRDTIVQRFQNDPTCRVFCGNIKAAGVGITLTAASYCVFNDRGWLPSDMAQAQDRLHRIGQTGTVNVYNIVDDNLLIDSILERILTNRSAEISSFEGLKQMVLKEAHDWLLRVS